LGGSRLAQAVSEISLSINKLGVVDHICNPSYMEGIGERISLRLALGKNKRPYLKNN
jgi:hypothetical protein